MSRAVPLVLLLVLAGCVSPGAQVETASTSPALAIPSAPEAFLSILCAGDVLEPLLDRAAKDCNVKVTTQNGPAAEVSVAVNPLDPLNLVGGAKDFTLGEEPKCGKYSVWSGLYVSKDGGRTWTNGFLPGAPNDARKTALSDYACGSDPVVVFGPEGYVYYTSLMYEDAPGSEPVHPILGPVSGGQGKSAIAVTRSRDGGTTWDDPVLLTTREGDGGLDKQWIAADPKTGQVYVTYIDTGTNVLQVQRSDDQGLTWTDPVPIVSPEEPPGGPLAVQFAQVGVGPDSLVHFTYWAAGTLGQPSAVYHRSSSDGGATWSEPRLVAPIVMPFDLGVGHKYRVVGMASLAVDAKSGAVYAAYPSRVAPPGLPSAPGGAAMYLAASTDAGATWTYSRIDDALPNPTNDRWMPAIAVGPDGTVHVTWMDYREDPAGQSARVYYAFSTDGGATWSPNAPVSDAAFDGTGGYHQSGSGTIGDYMGLAVSPLAVHPFWADTREGRNDVFAAILPAGAP